MLEQEMKRRNGIHEICAILACYTGDQLKMEWWSENSEIPMILANKLSKT